MFGLSGVMISIKSIDVHIGHESSVGVCFAKRSRIYRIGNQSWPKLRLKAKVAAGNFVSPRSHRAGVSACIGHDRVLVFGFRGVMISIKSIDLHIGHGRSVRVCIAKRLRIYRIGKTPWLASCLSVPR